VACLLSARVGESLRIRTLSSTRLFKRPPRHLRVGGRPLRLVLVAVAAVMVWDSEAGRSQQLVLVHLEAGTEDSRAAAAAVGVVVGAAALHSRSTWPAEGALE
jgi:hypothetical protein